MTFREFTIRVREAAEVALRIANQRSPTPMLHLQSRAGIVEALPVSADFFDTDADEQLPGMVRDLVRQLDAEMVAWTFSGNHMEFDGEGTVFDKVEVMVAITIDRERYEVWRAPIVRFEDPTLAVLGGWAAWDVNDVLAPHLIQPAQEALR